jgi:hypothetical protein
MHINVPGSGSAAKKDSVQTIDRFLRHPVEEVFNGFVSVETAESESFATNILGLMINKFEKSTSSNV